MKNMTKKLLLVLLCVALILPCVACATSNETEETEATTQGEAATEAETSYQPDIEVKNYDADFNVITPGFEKDLIYLEEGEGDSLSDAIYERGVKVKDHLGVSIVWQHAGDWITYKDSVLRTVQSGDDEYQLVMTPVYQGLTDLIISNALYDYGALDAVNLDAPYWAKDLMEDVKIGDQYLLGYSDFCLSDVHLLVFNKGMVADNGMEAPYQLVRDHEWTIAKLMEMASKVSEDNGDQKWDNQDTYGIAGRGWTYLISFITSSDMKIVDRDSEGLYKIAYENNLEKLDDLIETIFELYNAKYSYFWKSLDNTNPDANINFADGRTMFQFFSSKALPELRDVTFKFGILPYPKYDAKQESYKTLSWNGMMVIPSTIKKTDMVGEVVELLAYYTGPVKTAYYEDLLGAKISEAPEDAEMLEMIWDSMVSDVGIITCNCCTQMDKLVYMIPQMCEANKNTRASYLRTNVKRAQDKLDDVFKQ